tara:strand:+ start:400 stop:627 length:228 start_codon:yes stop_codon:yes gene_type:complete
MVNQYGTWLKAQQSDDYKALSDPQIERLETIVELSGATAALFMFNTCLYNYGSPAEHLDKLMKNAEDALENSPDS